MGKRLGLILGMLGMVAACEVNALALQIITYAEHGVGYWFKGSEFNGDKTLPLGVQRSVDLWNGDASSGYWSSGEDGATFTQGSGSLLPAVLPDVTTYGGRAGSSQVDNSSGKYSYLTAKYGTEQVVFYVGGINDVLVVPSSLPFLTVGKLSAASSPSPGFSHVTWLGAAPSTSVPDGGLTAVLLGLGISSLALVRHRLN